MTDPTLRLEWIGVPSAAPLAVVALDRRSGVHWHADFARVELVDHLMAWVFEDGMVLAAVQRRSVLAEGRTLQTRAVQPPRQAALTDIERHDVLHAARVRADRSVRDSVTRWEVA